MDFNNEDIIIFEAKKCDDSKINIVCVIMLIIVLELLIFTRVKYFVIPTAVIMTLAFIIILTLKILLIKNHKKDRLYVTPSYIIMYVNGRKTYIKLDDVVDFTEFLVPREGTMTLIKTKDSEFVFPYTIRNFYKFGKCLSTVSKNFSMNKLKLTSINLKFLHGLSSLLCFFIITAIFEKCNIYKPNSIIICMVILAIHILFFLYLFYKKYFTEEYRLIREEVKKEKQMNNEKGVPDGEICPICGQRMYKNETSCHNCHLFFNK